MKKFLLLTLIIVCSCSKATVKPEKIVEQTITTKDGYTFLTKQEITIQQKLTNALYRQVENQIDLQRRLNKLRREEGDYRRDVKIGYTKFLKRMEKRPKNIKIANALHKLGNIYYNIAIHAQGEKSLINLNKAKHLYMRLINEYPNYSELDNVTYSLGTIYEYFGAKDSAITQYRSIVNRGNNSRFVENSIIKIGMIDIDSLSESDLKVVKRNTDMFLDWYEAQFIQYKLAKKEQDILNEKTSIYRLLYFSDDYKKLKEHNLIHYTIATHDELLQTLITIYSKLDMGSKRLEEDISIHYPEMVTNEEELIFRVFEKALQLENKEIAQQAMQHIKEKYPNSKMAQNLLQIL